MGQTDRKQMTLSEPQGSRTERHQNNDLLQQMTVLRAIVQSLSICKMCKAQRNECRKVSRLQVSVSRKITGIWSRRWRPRWKKASKTNKWPDSRPKMRSSRWRKKDQDALKEEMKGLQIGSGRTVCSEASTGVRLGGSGTIVRPPSFCLPVQWNFHPKEDGI